MHNNQKSTTNASTDKNNNHFNQQNFNNYKLKIKSNFSKNNKYHHHHQQQPLVGNQMAANGSRKKSLTNPVITTPMKSVRESRSPSPVNNDPASQFTHQSAPMNISKNRFRTMSSGSTGSFSANSSFSSSLGACYSPVSLPPKKTSSNQTNSIKPAVALNDASLEEKLASSGNMFHSRENYWSILNQIPLSKQNAVHIRLEDDGPYGNDETRCYLLSHFSTLGIRDIPCVLCR